MQIEVLSVSQPSFTKTEKGGYNKIEVAYKSDGKVAGKQLVDFGTGKSVYDYFIANKGSGIVEITTEKSGKFVNWTAVATATAGTPNTAPQQDTASSASSAGSTSPATGRGKVTGSNYETTEERAKRQIYIVRQSSVSNAIATLAREGTKALDPAEVITIAKVYEAYVFGKEQPNAVSETYQGETVPV